MKSLGYTSTTTFDHPERFAPKVDGDGAVGFLIHVERRTTDAVASCQVTDQDGDPANGDKKEGFNVWLSFDSAALGVTACGLIVRD